MPAAPVPEKATFWQWLFVAVVLAAILTGVLTNPPLRWAFAGTFSFMALLSLLHRRWLNRIRAERKEESICTFARALPAKAHDTWVVRAVYEEVSSRAGVPIRPSDDFLQISGLDGDDLDDAVSRMAFRAGRSMESTKENPIFDRVVTVADVIAFLEHQPKIPEKVSWSSCSARS
jgi:hypothetical protein